MYNDRDKLREVSDWMRALANHDRLPLIAHLAYGQCTPTDLSHKLKLDIVNISHSLGELRKVGIVDSKKMGRNQFYFLKDATVNLKTLILRKHSIELVITLE